MKRAISLYIHVPWCVKKCPYCDFNSHQAPRSLPEQDYAAALIRDLDHILALTGKYHLRSIFFGGGTPSLMSVEFFNKILNYIGQKFSTDQNLEITLEANPHSSETQKFASLQQLGVNRISLGVQSFKNSQLKVLGRAHNEKEADLAINAIIQAGFKNFNLDLMHSLPEQTLAEAEYDLKKALSYQPPHLSWYQLTIEPKTVYAKFPPKLPSEEVIENILERGNTLLTAAGYSNYEVSAYAQDHMQCQHNLNYWQYGDYIGIGAGAHSKITLDNKVIRYARYNAPLKYLQHPDVAVDWHSVDDDNNIFEFMLNNLRLRAGFSEQNFVNTTALSLNLVQAKLDDLISRGLLERVQNNYRLSALGQRFLNDVMLEFLVEN